MHMHDHTKKTEPMYCTLMKEICHQGWTESMGLGDPKTGIKPRCHKWVGVFVNNPQAVPPIQEVFDCNEQWNSDLIQQVAQETYQGATATESVRNHVAENTGVNKLISSFFIQLAEATGHKLKMSEIPPALKNGNGNKQ